MITGVSSFRALFAAGGRVEIPVIQRDYAQGRDDERSREVRQRFLDALAGALSSDASTAPLDLDFLYGSQQGPILELLDGQQRVTTLFLLHWYIACCDGAFADLQSWILHAKNRSSFSYRTRTSAAEFFDALVQAPVRIDQLPARPGAVSAWLTDAVWFVRAWRRDPTVRGCLTMLDAIHERATFLRGRWQRLASTASPAIVFRLLPLAHFGLADDLYVKMNARGKALTRLEVFKAEFERFVGETFVNETCPHEPQLQWRTYVSRQFDNAWTNLLWRKRGKTDDIDSSFMHLLRALAMVCCSDRSAHADLLDQVEELLKTTQPSVPFLAELGCLDRTLVERIVAALDTLARHLEAPRFLGRGDYLDESTLFQRILLARGANHEGGLTLVDWVMFSAWCSFLLRFTTDLGDAAVRTAFHDWIRVVGNLTHNSEIDSTERLIAALQGLRQLSGRCGAVFLSRVADGILAESGGFNKQQQREEQLKAQLILRNAAWRPLIEDAETHPYFRGNIEFLLLFSGIVDRRADTGNCDWSDADDSALRLSFGDWYTRACAVFPRDATVWPRPLPEFLLERALLATGDYRLPQGSNLSLLDEKGEASWKRLLCADMRLADRDARRDVLRQVLARIDHNDLDGSLRAIIAAGVQGADPDGLRKRLVAEPRLIKYCRKRMLRAEAGTVFLLSKLRRAGTHHDLFVYDLYLKLQAKLAQLAPLTMVSAEPVCGARDQSTCVLRTPNDSLTLEVVKLGDEMNLSLMLKKPAPELAARLTSWTAEDDLRMRRSVVPDAAEAAILDLVATFHALAMPQVSPC